MKKNIEQRNNGVKLMIFQDNRGELYLFTGAWKRVVDVILSGVLLFAALPILILLAGWIRMNSQGKVIFRQTRVGLNGEEFELFKFRTMELGADEQLHQRHVLRLVDQSLPMQKLEAQRDERLIVGAKLIRGLGLDELPQLWNILKGEMSLVGPRPCLPWEYEQLYVGALRQRFAAVPGLTGLWQVKGKNRLTFSEMVALDVEYGRHASLVLDLIIIAKTPFAVLEQIFRKNGAMVSPTKSKKDLTELTSVMSIKQV